ncbi:progonadoliberin-1 isoform X1 [Anarrhichthys ocellatus]|uniref:progonadoliberin-1 isoform X1 n=2 Tax=Anarrhichthys ocellatus TaxID=433405 RepID=UPI0012EE5E72|nr:progonadoliberin-1 isoform X1 [Anarrhichthys ocellatus]
MCSLSPIRMAPKTLALCLLLVGAILPQGGCQHWSYGLNPGGKRDLDSLSDTLNYLVEALPHVDTPCSVLGCAEESHIAKIYRSKRFLGSANDRENGHITY